MLMSLALLYCIVLNQCLFLFYCGRSYRVFLILTIGRRIYRTDTTRLDRPNLEDYCSTRTHLHRPCVHLSSYRRIPVTYWSWTRFILTCETHHRIRQKRSAIYKCDIQERCSYIKFVLYQKSIHILLDFLIFKYTILIQFTSHISSY